MGMLLLACYSALRCSPYLFVGAAWPFCLTSETFIDFFHFDNLELLDN